MVDDCRLENLQGYLDTVKNGQEKEKIQALEQVERILLRIHNPYAIAWDFGGVLMDGHNKFFIELYAYSQGVDLPKEQLKQLWQTIFKGDPIPGVNYDALKIGQATPEQFARHAIANFNNAFAEAGQKQIELTDAAIRHFLTLYYSHYDAKHETREVLHRIEQLGIRQYGLTNNFMAKVEYFLEQHEFDYLQGLIAIVSEKFGASKPAPGIYLSFKQHVFLDRFATDVLGVNLSNDSLHQLWQAIFAQSGEVDSQEAIAHYSHILDRAIDSRFSDRWRDFWTNYYDRIAAQTIFIDDKTRNIEHAFEYEGILGVYYDANQGQKIASEPVIKELLEQEQLKEVVRSLRELTAAQNSLGQRAQQALQRLMPFRIRHEKLIWQTQIKEHQPIIEALSNEQIYSLLDQHYKPLHTTYFQLGQLVERQYALIHRLAILPDYTYDAARQVVIELFETSALFLDQNRDLYPWQDTEIPEDVATDLGDLQKSESLLKTKLLPEIKRKITEYINALDASHQPIIGALMNLLHTQVNVQQLKQFMDQLLQQLMVLKSMRVVPWEKVEQCFAELRDQNGEPASDQLERWYQQLHQETQQTSIDLLPLERMIAEWEAEIDLLESTYFEQYAHWKTLKDEEKTALYQDAILDGVCDRFSAEALYQLIRGLMLRVYDLPHWKDITKPTIILVSGASGSGKSTLATQLAQIFGMQKVFSTDEAGRANAKAILDFLFEEEAASAFPGLYQSSFEGSIESYYYQAILTMIGVEGLLKRLHKQNTSALLEGVGLLPGLLSPPVFELVNIDWLVVQVDRHQHYQNFARRAQSAVHRDAKRYQDNFEMIRQIYDQINKMGINHELTMIENTGAIEQSVTMATERIKSRLKSQFVEVHDPMREEIKERLAKQRQHLPIKVRFDVQRAAMNTGIEEKTIVELLHRFGFEEMPNKSHQWIQKPLQNSSTP